MQPRTIISKRKHIQILILINHYFITKLSNTNIILKIHFQMEDDQEMDGSVAKKLGKRVLSATPSSVAADAMVPSLVAERAELPDASSVHFSDAISAAALRRLMARGKRREERAGWLQYLLNIFTYSQEFR